MKTIGFLRPFFYTGAVFMSLLMAGCSGTNTPEGRCAGVKAAGINGSRHEP